MGDVVLGIAQCTPQGLHQFSTHWLDMVIQEVWLKIVYTELKCTQTLKHKSYKGLTSDLSYLPVKMFLVLVYSHLIFVTSIYKPDK